ncbi:MAG: thioredoxin, partial [Chloroflexota bacterium]
MIEAEDDLDGIFAEYYQKGWTDGLPIVPPTEARVRRMIEASGRSPDEVVGVFPPRQAQGTVEQIAVNAVMAGCLPE